MNWFIAGSGEATAAGVAGRGNMLGRGPDQTRRWGLLCRLAVLRSELWLGRWEGLSMVCVYVLSLPMRIHVCMQTETHVKHLSSGSTNSQFQWMYTYWCDAMLLNTYTWEFRGRTRGLMGTADWEWSVAVRSSRAHCVHTCTSNMSLHMGHTGCGLICFAPACCQGRVERRGMNG